MITEYPIHIERDYTHSSNPRVQEKAREFNEYCSKIETWINKQIKQGRRGTIHYSEINNALYLPEDFLGKKLIIDGGHTGFRIAENIIII